MVKVEVVIQLQGKHAGITVNRLRREDAIQAEIDMGDLFYKELEDIVLAFTKQLEKITGFEIPVEKIDGDYGEGKSNE